jgi:hypothetical protein
MTASAAINTPSQNGRNPLPGPNVAEEGIIQDSQITYPDRSNNTKPVIKSAFFINRTAYSHNSIKGRGAENPRPRRNAQPRMKLLLLDQTHVLEDNRILRVPLL